MSKAATLVWVDAQGETCLHVIRTQTGVGAIETALEEYSQGGVIECWEGTDETYSPTPGTDVYPTVRVVARLIFQGSAGSTASLYIPAPSGSIFLSDGVTVDPSAIPDIITAALGNLLCGNGSVATIFLGGTIIRTRFSGIASTDF